MLTEKKFEEVFREYYQPLRVYALRYIVSTDTANDIVQEVFYNLWKIKDNFVVNSSIKSYLFSAVYYRCLNYLKQEKRTILNNQQNIEVIDKFSCYYMENAINYKDSIFSDDTTDKIRKCISELPDQCRRIFILSRKFGLKNREIAEFLEISQKNIEKQIAKALAIIMNKL